jgi:hypothetical protein
VLTLPAAAVEEAQPCGDGIVVVAEAPADREQACAAVEDAIPFLRGAGLTPPPPTTIRLVEAIPGNGTGHSLGRYDARTGEIVLLSPAAAVAAAQCGSPAFGIPMSPALWRSYVVHELAHAAAERHFAPRARSLVASEYIAAVAQLATLPEGERGVILEQYADTEPYTRPREMSELYYFMDPCRFAVKCYLHYLQPGNGDAFVRHVLDRGLYR